MPDCLVQLVGQASCEVVKFVDSSLILKMSKLIFLKYLPIGVQLWVRYSLVPFEVGSANGCSACAGAMHPRRSTLPHFNTLISQPCA